MFLHSYVHSLDSKNRLTIPSKYRDQLTAGLVLTPNALHPCIDLYPQSEWDELMAVVKQLKWMDPAAAELRRLLFSDAEDLKPDSQGRIVLRQELRAHAHIDTDAVLAGVGNYVEIWSPEKWQEHKVKQRSDPEVSRKLLATLEV